MTTANLLTELEALLALDALDAHSWPRYHAVIDELCQSHPAIETAWEAWTNANQHLDGTKRMLAGAAILPVVKRIAAEEQAMQRDQNERPLETFRQQVNRIMFAASNRRREPGADDSQILGDVLTALDLALITCTKDSTSARLALA
ncbi:hypothetical protein [Nocardia sp. NPDC060249]|uniref:hypothetical protein n=1 Tax=Nocardia sp. NPDC060249 TaxID=3347082 RepID=UPI003664659B